MNRETNDQKSASAVEECPQIGNDVTTVASNQSKTSTNGSSEGNRTGFSVSTNDIANSTVTIVLERAKPLILRLRHPEHGLLGWGEAKKPDDDIDKAVNTLDEELIENISKAIFAIRDEAKQARPRPQQENYQARTEAYVTLLGYVTDLVNRLGSMFRKSLTEYRRLINELWENLQRAHDDHEREQYVQQFLTRSEHSFRDAVQNEIEPLLKSVEEKFNQLT